MNDNKNNDLFFYWAVNAQGVVGRPTVIVREVRIRLVSMCLTPRDSCDMFKP